MAESEAVKCDVCGREFADLRGLPAHRRIVHGIKGATELCPLCGKQVASSYIRQHRTKYHYGAGAPVPVPKVVERAAEPAVARRGRVEVVPSDEPEEVRAVDHGAELRIRVDEDGVWVHMTIADFTRMLEGYDGD